MGFLSLGLLLVMLGKGTFFQVLLQPTHPILELAHLDFLELAHQVSKELANLGSLELARLNCLELVHLGS